MPEKRTNRKAQDVGNKTRHSKNKKNLNSKCGVISSFFTIDIWFLRKRKSIIKVCMQWGAYSLKNWGNEMRRIAIITDGWRRYSNYAWIDGCRRYAKETHMDVEFYVFHSFGNFSKDVKFNLGEYSIWELVNFNDFDAVIFEITNISEGEIRQQLIARAKEAKIPVLSLVEEMDVLLGYEKGEIIDVTSQKVKIDDKYCPFRMSERATE